MDAPKGASYLQYAIVPALEDELPSGRYILTSSDPALLDSVGKVLNSEGLELQAFRPSSLVMAVVTNPLVLVAFSLFSSGIVFASIYWRTIHARNTHKYLLRYGSGATLARILFDEALKVSTVLIPTVSLGAYSAPLLVRWISGVDAASEIHLFLVCASSLGIVVLLCTYIGTLFLAARKVLGKAKHV